MFGGHSLTPSTQICAKVAGVLEQRTPTIYNECETEVAVFVCCGCSSKSNILSGVYVYVGVFSADAKIWFVGMPVLCGNSFPRLQTLHFINFAARRDWRLHRDEACYCPVSGMPSGLMGNQLVTYAVVGAGFATPMKGFLQASKNLRFRRLVWKNFIYFFLD